MRIKKVSQSIPIKAKVVNSYSESEEETYSCDYINNVKAAEQSTGWTNVSLTSYLRGPAGYVRIGNIVIVKFNGVNINQNITQNATVLATGLPKASTNVISLLTNYISGGHLRILITDTGNIQNHWSTVNASNNDWYGTLMYITNE